MAQEGTDEHLDRTFFALSDSTRRSMLAQLARGEVSVTELAAPHAMSLPAILKHLKVLREAGLIFEEKEGRVRRCRLDAEALMKANTWIGHYRKFWDAQLDVLATYLEDLEVENKARKVRPKKRKKSVT